jgi:metal-responsive CopG/Arc/MetJ family transcriptional regulator
MVRGITKVILSVMKTAVSIPDHLFRSAEHLAKRRGVPRSRLYAEAFERYLAENDEGEVIAKLNEIYDHEPSELDPVIAALQWASIEPEKW